MKFLVLSLLTLAAVSSAHAGIGPSNGTARAFNFSSHGGGGNAPEPASTALLLMGAGAVGGKILKNRKNKKNKDQDQA